jgi:hypothetical protein
VETLQVRDQLRAVLVKHRLYVCGLRGVRHEDLEYVEGPVCLTTITV